MVTNRFIYRSVPFVVCAILVALVFTVVVSVANVNAGVGPGGSAANSGGGACPDPIRSGVNGCPFTPNGNGWYEIPVDSPNAPTGNGFWNTANPTCKSEGATHVIAYVVLTGERTLSAGWIYRYLWSWAGLTPYTGNISANTAEARFNELPENERGNYQFGVNLGWFCYTNESWDTTGTTTVDRSSALPGDQIRWTHTLSQTGRTGTRSIYSQTVNSGFAGNTRFNGTHNATDGALSVGGSRSHSSYGTYTVEQADVGNDLCQQLQWDPTNSTGGRHGRATNACVNIPFRYTLRPEIRNLRDGTVVESNDTTLTIPGRLTNEGPTRSRAVSWRISQIEYGPSIALGAIPNKAGGENISQDPCDFYTSPARTSCGRVNGGPIAAGVAFPGYEDVSVETNLANKPAGTKVCFALSIIPYSHANENWRHSALICFVIGKKPKVQVLSGDLIVGRASPSNGARTSAIVTSMSTNGGRQYGSWAEYAIIPSGCVTGMASGSGFVGGATTDVLSDLSLLTFTNPSRTIEGQSGCESGVGRYIHSSVAPNVAARFPIQVTAADATPARPANPIALPSAAVDLNSTSPRLNGHYQAPAGASLVTIDGGEIGAGRWVVISAPNAVVTIRSNIQYTNAPLNESGDIPQVVIIARDIIIEDDVERIDAWLVAVGTDVVNGAGTVTQQRGIVNTCGAGSAGITTTSALTVNTCDRGLTVNGPVVANYLVLRRTAGSGPGTAMGEPAEVFNLRPDSYLWATWYNAATGRLSTVETKELPPRF